jgi:hypothetical protein
MAPSRGEATLKLCPTVASERQQISLVALAGASIQCNWHGREVIAIQTKGRPAIEGWTLQLDATARSDRQRQRGSPTAWLLRTRRMDLSSWKINARDRDVILRSRRLFLRLLDGPVLVSCSVEGDDPHAPFQTYVVDPSLDVALFFFCHRVLVAQPRVIESARAG